jgi:hypothetical protein
MKYRYRKKVNMKVKIINSEIFKEMEESQLLTCDCGDSNPPQPKPGPGPTPPPTPRPY